MGKNIGKHKGAHYFTIGQRKGLNVGGTKYPLFPIILLLSPVFDDIQGTPHNIDSARVF